MLDDNSTREVSVAADVRRSRESNLDTTTTGNGSVDSKSSIESSAAVALCCGCKEEASSTSRDRQVRVASAALLHA